MVNPIRIRTRLDGGSVYTLYWNGKWVTLPRVGEKPLESTDADNMQIGGGNHLDACIWVKRVVATSRFPSSYTDETTSASPAQPQATDRTSEVAEKFAEQFRKGEPTFVKIGREGAGHFTVVPNPKLTSNENTWAGTEVPEICESCHDAKYVNVDDGNLSLGTIPCPDCE